MTPACAFRRILLTAVVPIALAGCEVRSENSGRAQAAIKDETGEQQAARSKPVSTGHADVDGGRIFYQVHGDLKSGKTPLLVLHGSFMSGDAMTPFVEALAETRPVIAIDARGHGRTGDLPGNITYELMADDAVAVLKSLDIPSADVFGYSMGGTTAIVMAVRHPDHVGKQIILSGAARRDGWYPEVREGMAKATTAQFEGTPIEAEYQRLSPTPDKFSTFVEEVTGLEAQNFDVANNAVHAIDDKTMIIVGDADGVSLDHAVELFKLRGGGDKEAAGKGILTEAPRARLAILPAASHVGMMAEARKITDEAAAFLDDRAPPPPTGFFGNMAEPASKQSASNG